MPSEDAEIRRLFEPAPEQGIIAGLSLIVALVWVWIATTVSWGK